MLEDGKALNPRDLNAHLRSGRVTPKNIAEYEPVSKVSETSEKAKTEEEYLSDDETAFGIFSLLLMLLFL